MKKSLIALILCLFTFSVFAKDTILIIGDSLSAGYGLGADQGWVNLLQNRLNHENYDYKVVNVSISGQTTSNGLAELPKALTDHQPKITIIELGGNDGLRGVQLATIRNNLQKMISLAKNANSKVLLLGLRLPPNYGLAYTQQFQNIFSELASENNIGFVPLFLKDIDENPTLMSQDRIHPTEKAQAIMLENIWLELKKLL